MSSCSIKWCGKNSRSSSFSTDGITFHRFPKTPKLKEKWIDVTRRENWFPSSYSVICSRHFTENCFINSKKTRRLIETAVPTLFLPTLVQEKDPLAPEVQQSQPALIILTPIANQSTPILSFTPVQNIPVEYVPSSVPTDHSVAKKILETSQQSPSQFNKIPTNHQLIRSVATLSNKIAKKNKLIKNLRENVRYLKKRVEVLSEIIKGSKGKKSIKSETLDTMEDIGETSNRMKSKNNIMIHIKAEASEAVCTSESDVESLNEIIKHEINETEQD